MFVYVCIHMCTCECECKCMDACIHSCAHVCTYVYLLTPRCTTYLDENLIDGTVVVLYHKK